eukprot:RCo023176
MGSPGRVEASRAPQLGTRIPASPACRPSDSTWVPREDSASFANRRREGEATLGSGAFPSSGSGSIRSTTWDVGRVHTSTPAPGSPLPPGVLRGGIGEPAAPAGLELDLNLATIRRRMSTFESSPTRTRSTFSNLTSTDTGEGSGRKPLVVVLVDDNRINLMLLRKMVQMTLTSEVHICEGGRQALDLLLGGAVVSPERAQVVVLTDIHMPEVCGLELTRQLRLQWTVEVVPIIGVTADRTATLHEQCLQAGMQAVLTKPVLSPQLVETVQAVLPSSAPSGSVARFRSATDGVLASASSPDHAVQNPASCAPEPAPGAAAML